MQAPSTGCLGEEDPGHSLVSREWGGGWLPMLQQDGPVSCLGLTGVLPPARAQTA